MINMVYVPDDTDVGKLLARLLIALGRGLRNLVAYYGQLSKQ